MIIVLFRRVFAAAGSLLAAAALLAVAGAVEVFRLAYDRARHRFDIYEHSLLASPSAPPC